MVTLVQKNFNNVTELFLLPLFPLMLVLLLIAHLELVLLFVPSTLVLVLQLASLAPVSVTVLAPSQIQLFASVFRLQRKASSLAQIATDALLDSTDILTAKVFVSCHSVWLKDILVFAMKGMAELVALNAVPFLLWMDSSAADTEVATRQQLNVIASLITTATLVKHSVLLQQLVWNNKVLSILVVTELLEFASVLLLLLLKLVMKADSLDLVVLNAFLNSGVQTATYLALVLVTALATRILELAIVSLIRWKGTGLLPLLLYPLLSARGVLMVSLEMIVQSEQLYFRLRFLVRSQQISQ
jgi:hypothetical protein